MGDSTFRVIEGGQAEKPKRKRAPRAKHLWNGCNVCEAKIGVRSRVVMRAIASPFEDNEGNISGGRKVLLCAMCLARGEYTAVTA